MKRLLIAIGIAVVIGLSVNTIGRLAYARGWIDVDVRDEHGHGPDRGREWDRAARFHIARGAILSGLASCPLAILALIVRRNGNANNRLSAGKS